MAVKSWAVNIRQRAVEAEGEKEWKRLRVKGAHIKVKKVLQHCSCAIYKTIAEEQKG